MFYNASKLVNFENYWKRRRLILLTFMSALVLTTEEAIAQGLQNRYGMKSGYRVKNLAFIMQSL